MKDFLNQAKKTAPPRAEDSMSLFAGTSQRKPDVPLQFQQILSEEVHVHPGSRIVLHTDPLSPGADRFRFLRMCLRELWSAGKLRSLLITSALPLDGKSTIALNLATALAEGGKRSVLLLEADLHKPSLNEQLGLKARPGLTELLKRRLRRTAPLHRPY